MQSFFRRPDRKRKYMLIAGDFSGIAASLLLTFAFQMIYRKRLDSFFEPFSGLPLLPKILAVCDLSILFIGFSLFVGLTYITTYYIVGLYEIEVIFGRKRTLVKLSTGILCGAFIVFGLLRVFSQGIFGAKAWGFHLCSLLFILFWWRYWFSARLGSEEPYRILVIEKDNLAEKAMAYLNGNGGSKLFRFILNSSGDFFKQEILQGRTSRRQNDYHMIVYPYLNGFSPDDVAVLVKKKFAGLAVCNSLTFYKNCTGTLPVFHMDGQWLINLSTSLALTGRHQRRVKRVLDILFSSIGLLIAAPIMITAAILIKLTSKGPIVYKQKRVGLYDKIFTTHKLRSMVDDAEKATGPVWAKKRDLRVTPVGSFLRKTRIDEIPQLFDVLRGDMSFVGPRPIREVFEDEFSRKIPFYFLRHLVKPGITGWAQVNDFDARAEDGPLRRLEYDLFYIQEYSLLLDSVILLKTVQKMLQARGQ